MPKDKKTIRLIATGIEFTFNSIVYEVEPEQKVSGKYIPACADDIQDKDLVMKPTVISDSNKKIVFATNFATPQFYQGLLTKTTANADEYSNELKKIYGIGDTVAVILK